MITRIAFTGKLRSGKSYAASYISRKQDGFIRVSFGDKLKFVANELFEGSDVYPSEVITRDCGLFGEYVVSKRKPRRLYQDFGQKLRELDPDIWVRQLASTIEVYEDMRSTRGIIIDDLRQPNEYEWCRANGFVIVRINASLDDRVKRAEIAGDAFEMADLAHDTERHVDSFEVDYVIDNTGDYDAFEAQLDDLMAKISEGQAVTIGEAEK